MVNKLLKMVKNSILAQSNLLLLNGSSAAAVEVALMMLELGSRLLHAAVAEGLLLLELLLADHGFRVGDRLAVGKVLWNMKRKH